CPTTLRRAATASTTFACPNALPTSTTALPSYSFTGCSSASPKSN
ncbi:hypothetical protein, partial [Pseudomonas sp. FEN]